MSRQPQLPQTLEQFLHQAQAESCTDIHLSPGHIPHWRIRGDLQPTDFPAVAENQFWQWMGEILATNQLERFQQGNTINQIVQYANATFSLHGHWTTTGPAIALRLPILTIPDMDQLGLPERLKDVIQSPTGQWSQGLILVAGMTGSGKSTSLASLVNHINATACCHIVTLDDPLLFIYPQQRATFTQWVSGIHIDSLVDGITQAQRIDADVMVINEISDRPTLDQALCAANRGCLVLASLHADRAIDALETIFSFYSEAEQPFIRHRLSKTLKALLGQRLTPPATGEFRRAALHDLLIVTPTVQSKLADGHMNYLASRLNQDAEMWPHTMTQDLQRLLADGRVSQETFTAVSQVLQRDELQPF